MHRCSLLVLALFIVTAALTACRSSSGIQDEFTTPPLNLPKAWTMAGGDATQSGYFDWAGPDTGDIKWVQNQNLVLTPLYETPGGTLICDSDSGIAALDTDGTELWRFSAGRFSARDAFSINSDGTYSFLGGSSELLTIDPGGIQLRKLDMMRNFADGRPQWVIDCRIDNQGRPYVIYRFDHNATPQIEALDHDGSVRWQIAMTNGFPSDYQVVGNRLFLFEGHSDIGCYSLDGELLWTLDFSPMSLIDVGIAADGGIYAALRDETEDRDYFITYIGPDGTRHWTHEIDTPSSLKSGSQLCGVDGEFYCQIAYDLHVFHPDGDSEILVTGIDGLAGVSTTGNAVAYTRQETYPDEERYCTGHLVKPDGSVNSITINGISSLGGLVGHDTNVFVRHDSAALSKIPLSGLQRTGWDYRAALMPQGMAIDANGTCNLFYPYELGTFNSSGGVDQRLELPFEVLSGTNPGTGAQEYTPAYCGYWPEAGLHIFSSGHYIVAWNPGDGIAWRCDSFGGMGNVTISDLVIDAAGVFVTTRNRLFNLDADGASHLLYESDTCNGFSSMAIARNGIIYLMGDLAELHAISPDGSEIWVSDANLDVYGKLTSASDDLLLVSAPNAIHAINTADGSRSWYYSYPGRKTAKHTPTVSPSGAIGISIGNYPEVLPGICAYWQLSDNEFVILNFEGNQINSVTGLGSINQQPVTGLAGNFYLLNDDGMLSAVDRTGSTRWQTDLSQYFCSELHDMLLAPSPSGGLICAHHDCVIGIGE